MVSEAEEEALSARVSLCQSEIEREAMVEIISEQETQLATLQSDLGLMYDACQEMESERDRFKAERMAAVVRQFEMETSFHEMEASCHEMEASKHEMEAEKHMLEAQRNDAMEVSSGLERILLKMEADGRDGNLELEKLKIKVEEQDALREKWEKWEKWEKEEKEEKEERLRQEEEEEEERARKEEERLIARQRALEERLTRAYYPETTLYGPRGAKESSSKSSDQDVTTSAEEQYGADDSAMSQVSLSDSNLIEQDPNRDILEPGSWRERNPDCPPFALALLDLLLTPLKNQSRPVLQIQVIQVMPPILPKRTRMNFRLGILYSIIIFASLAMNIQVGKLVDRRPVLA